jgi:hypothetical protein
MDATLIAPKLLPREPLPASVSTVLLYLSHLSQESEVREGTWLQKTKCIQTLVFGDQLWVITSNDSIFDRAPSKKILQSKLLETRDVEPDKIGGT